MAAARYLEGAGLLLAMAGYVPYIAGVVRGTTRPSPVSWAIWTVQGAALLATYFGLRQWEGIAMPVVAVIGPAVVMSLAFWRAPIALSRLDMVSITGTLGAGILWASTGSASWALYCLVTTDLCGALPTIAKTAKEPRSEDLVAWGLFLVGNLLVGLSITRRTLNSLVYPAYLVALCALVVALSLRRFASGHRATRNSGGAVAREPGVRSTVTGDGTAS